RANHAADDQQKDSIRDAEGKHVGVVLAGRAEMRGKHDLAQEAQHAADDECPADDRRAEREVPASRRCYLRPGFLIGTGNEWQRYAVEVAGVGLRGYSFAVEYSRLQATSPAVSPFAS